MDPFKDVRVDVISNGQKLALYHDPDAEEHPLSRSRSRYIEASTGATFKLEISLGPEFDVTQLGRIDAVRVKAYFDEGSGQYRDIPKEWIDSRRSQGKKVSKIFDSIAYRDAQTGKTVRGQLSFGRLATSRCPV